MCLLISPGFIIVIILFCNAFVSSILKGKIDKHTDFLIRSIIGLPAIPVFWLWTSSEPSSFKFFSFYLPLFVTVYLILMLVISIIKYNKNKH